MNERIRELYSQAGLTMNNPLAYEQWYLDALEKFAELIVKECIAWVEDNNGHDGPSISEMKEHFGVEE